MIVVKKPIGAVKVGKVVSRLTVGKQVPEVVSAYWKKSGQYSELLKSGVIEDTATVVQKSSPSIFQDEEKKEKKEFDKK